MISRGFCTSLCTGSLGKAWGAPGLRDPRALESWHWPWLSPPTITYLLFSCQTSSLGTVFKIHWITSPALLPRSLAVSKLPCCVFPASLSKAWSEWQWNQHRPFSSGSMQPSGNIPQEPGTETNVKDTVCNNAPEAFWVKFLILNLHIAKTVLLSIWQEIRQMVICSVTQATQTPANTAPNAFRLLCNNGFQIINVTRA